MRCSPTRHAPICAVQIAFAFSRACARSAESGRASRDRLCRRAQCAPEECECLPGRSPSPDPSSPRTCRPHRRDARDWRRRMPERATPERKTGSTMVMSGRCVPPAYGSLRMAMSPGFKRIAAIAACTDMGMEPRCTGMWSPIAITRPARRKLRKSNRGAP